MTRDPHRDDLLGIVLARDAAWAARHASCTSCSCWSIDPSDPEPVLQCRIRAYVPGEFGPAALHDGIDAVRVVLADDGRIERRPLVLPLLRNMLRRDGAR